MTVLLPSEAPAYADRESETDRRANEDRRQRDIGCDPWRGRDRRADDRRDRRRGTDRRDDHPCRIEDRGARSHRPPADAAAAAASMSGVVTTTVDRSWRPGQGRDRDNPTIWQAMRVDPTLHVPADSRALQIRDQQRWTRHVLRPVLRVLAMVVIHVSLFVKRLLPFRLGSERALNWIAPRFVRRFASPEALAYVLRHFVIETNLINFVARNSGAADVHEVSLRPTNADGLGDDGGLNAVVRHDANIFNHIGGPRPSGELDFSMLTMPSFDLELGTRRWIKLDLESTLHITVAALALFMDGATAERAVNSFQLDESMLACIADMTGDPVFRTWTPVKFPNWLGITNNVGRDLHWHIIVNEYAHERLCRLAATHEAVR